MRVIDDELLANLRMDRDRASGAKRDELTSVLDFVSARRGMTLDQAGTEAESEIRELSKRCEEADGRLDKTTAAHAAAVAGYFPAERLEAGSFNLRHHGAVNGAVSLAVEPAARVLDRHVRLHELLVRPNRVITGTVRWFAEDYADHAAGPVGELTRYMMWPYYVGGQRPRANWETQFLGALSRGLFNAPTYQVTAEMCDIAGAMYEQTAAEAGHIAASDLPSESGFLWLDKPFRRSDARGDSYGHRVVTWSPQAVRLGGEVHDGTRITLWADWSAEPELVTPKLQEDWAPWTTDCPLIMVMTAVIPFGYKFGGIHDDGVPEPLHYVHAVWLLLGTEVAVTSRGAGVSRQARRRALRSIKQNEVQVVTLRRAIHRDGGDDHEHREIDWSCRWLVRGFWRHRWGYGSVGRFHEGQGDGGDPPRCRACGARVTWVRPHVKGPDDAPLKAARKIYRLSR